MPGEDRRQGYPRDGRGEEAILLTAVHRPSKIHELALDEAFLLD